MIQDGWRASQPKLFRDLIFFWTTISITTDDESLWEFMTLTLPHWDIPGSGSGSAPWHAASQKSDATSDKGLPPKDCEDSCQIHATKITNEGNSTWFMSDDPILEDNCTLLKHCSSNDNETGAVKRDSIFCVGSFRLWSERNMDCFVAKMVLLWR